MNNIELSRSKVISTLMKKGIRYYAKALDRTVSHGSAVDNWSATNEFAVNKLASFFIQPQSILNIIMLLCGLSLAYQNVGGDWVFYAIVAFVSAINLYKQNADNALATFLLVICLRGHITKYETFHMIEGDEDGKCAQIELYVTQKILDEINGVDEDDEEE